MFGKLLMKIREHLVGEVPDEMSACLNCGANQCRDDRFRDCPDRLAHAAALKELRAREEAQGSRSSERQGTD